MITKKITAIFHEKERDMIKEIYATILEDKLKIYHQERDTLDESFTDLDLERKKIAKKRKNKKERNREYVNNTRGVLYNICKALNKTVIYYKTIYYENDYYRHKKLYDV